MSRIIRTSLLMLLLSFTFFLTVATAGSGVLAAVDPPSTVLPPTAAENVINQSFENLCNSANGPDNPIVCERRTDQTEGDNFLVGENGMITRLTQVLIWVSGTLALIMMIIAGLMFMFSSGNAESTGRAKRTMLYAITGMMVAILGQLIVTYVLKKL